MSAPPESIPNWPRYSDLPSLDTASASGRSQRSLPKRETSDETIADAYAQFILYCNPYFPLDVDTSELKRIFRSPPRSDGKDFNIYTLWELIQKFDSKEIKTWAQLALDLGVEPPSAERGGSVQKVQQYSVRLKRWMRAMHVDAFFEYLLGKRHTYFVDLPPLNDPHPAQGRDGVPAEEDLAIRALDPSFRPKRGRKRNESLDEEEPAPPKRPLLTTSFTYEGQTLYAQPQFAHPTSGIPLRAKPDGYTPDHWETPDSFAQRPIAPHSAITTRPPNLLQWPSSGPHDTPTTQYPMSAIETRRSNSAFDEPRSAITPSTSKARSRRKHGPAVSSAWPSSNNSSSSKLRGRPPVNRSVQDGPFTTFPVDPSKERTPSSQRTSPNIAIGPLYDDRSPPLQTVNYMTPADRRNTNGQPALGRPERLQVQVPQHIGRPIRLATPTVVVNGESRGNDSTELGRGQQYDDWQGNAVDDDMEDDYHEDDAPTNQFPRSVRAGVPERAKSQFSFEVLRRILAADLLRASFSGRRQRLLGPEATRLSTAILTRLGVPQEDSDSKSDDAARIAAASWIGASQHLGFNGGVPCKEKEVIVHRFAVRPDGSETALSEDQNAEHVRERFDVTWSLGFGGTGGRFCIVGVELEPAPVDVTDPEYRANEILASVKSSTDEVDWKSKFMALDLSVRLMKGQLNELQNKVLEAIL